MKPEGGHFIWPFGIARGVWNFWHVSEGFGMDEDRDYARLAREYDRLVIRSWVIAIVVGVVGWWVYG